MTGIYGKLPSNGDFVRRELPQSFVIPWDDWLQAGMGAARDALGEQFAAACAAAPAWRFRLPAGACGDSAVAGVLLSSHDTVGRLFPLTLAALLPPGTEVPNQAWYAALERAGLAAREQGDSADALMTMLPSTALMRSLASSDDIPDMGWWTAEGPRWRLAGLPQPAQFRQLLEGIVPPERLASRAATHQGTVRTRNEDAFVDRGDIGLWAVADGAGGHGAGDVASAAAVAALADMPAGLSAAETLAQVRLRIGAVHAELQRRAAGVGSDIMATTIVVLMARAGHFACLWAGDSRAYLLRDGELCQVTQDHSLVQEMVDAGTLAAEDAEGHPQANVITRAVGSQDDLALDKISGRILPGDVLLLCTDGLFKALPESRIAEALQRQCGPEELLEMALHAGARDNVTALVVQV